MKNKSHYALATAALLGSTTAVPMAHALEVELSGQVNRAILVADDGEDTEAYFVDNTNSSSRFRFSALGQLTDEIQAGALLEVEFESNPSSSISQDSPSRDGVLEERKVEVFFLGDWGGLYLGQGDGAANGITELDLSGTGVVALMGSTHLIGGGLQFVQDGALSGVTISDAIGNFDFESRYDRVAYETPAFGPVTLTASAGRKDEMIYEVGVRYASDFTFGKMVAGVGYSTEEVDGPAGSNDTVGGSVSFLLPSGFNAGVSYSQLENDAGYDANQTALRLGYRTGNHAASLDLAVAEDQALAGDEAEMVGLNYVYSPVAWAELYAAAKFFSLDRDGASDFEDINLFVFGSRVKF